MSATAKTLPFKHESPMVDAAFSTRRAEVHIRTGPLDNEVYAEVDLSIDDQLFPRRHQLKHAASPSLASVYWTMTRYKRVNGGKAQRIEDHAGPHTDICFATDEIEAFATALYQAVQLAKKQGYLPNGGVHS